MKKRQESAETTTEMLCKAIEIDLEFKRDGSNLEKAQPMKMLTLYK